MKTLKNILILAALLVPLAAHAADGGKLPVRTITNAGLSAEIAQLKQQVAALQKQMARLPFGHVQAADNNGIHVNALTADTVDTGTCSDIGLLLGNAHGDNVAMGTVASRITCELYEYSYSTIDGSIQPLSGMEWDGANCTGTVYATQSITPQLAQNGYVFSMLGQSSNFAVAAGSTLQTISVMSQSDQFGDCLDNSDNPFDDGVYSIVANVPSVTGVPNSAVPTKITNGGS